MKAEFHIPCYEKNLIPSVPSLPPISSDLRKYILHLSSSCSACSFLCDGEKGNITGTKNPELKELNQWLSSLTTIIAVTGLKLLLSTEMSHRMKGINERVHPKNLQNSHCGQDSPPLLKQSSTFCSASTALAGDLRFQLVFLGIGSCWASENALMI